MVDVDSLLIAGAVSALVSFTILFLKEFWIEPRRQSRELTEGLAFIGFVMLAAASSRPNTIAAGAEPNYLGHRGKADLASSVTAGKDQIQNSRSIIALSWVRGIYVLAN